MTPIHPGDNHCAPVDFAPSHQASTPGGATLRDSTAHLIHRIWNGDAHAREALARAYLPVAKRLAHGRLLANARGLVDTDDLASIAVTHALSHIDGFEPKREGAFLAYLHRILLNKIRDEIRRARARPAGDPVDETIPLHADSPLEELLGRESIERYESALARLGPEQREAVILRLEMGFSHQQVAEAVGARSPDAVRMSVARALLRLAEELNEVTRSL